MTLRVLRASPPGEQPIDEAAHTLRQGGLVAVPTETVYGLAARADLPDAVERLRGLHAERGRGPLAWHAPSTTDLLRVVYGPDRGVPPVHRRLIDRLSPGPALFAFELDDDRAALARRRLGVEPGVVDDGDVLLARVPAHPTALGLIRRAGGPVVVTGLPTDDIRAALGVRTADEAAALLDRSRAAASVDAVLPGEPAPLGRPSTRIRLLPDDGFTVEREGAYEKRYIEKQLMRRILFVCTGNTCRSPMAQAIARSLVEERERGREDAIRTEVGSAGAFASSGAPATPEAVRAMEEMGLPMHEHASRPLTRELLNTADVVFALTASHREAILAIDPSAAPRVKLLDPEGADVPDPIGAGQEVYTSTAKRLRELIERRLNELGV